MVDQYIREVSVLIGPLRDDVPVGTASDGVLINSTGDRAELAVEFVVEKTVTSSPNKSRITILNLGRDLRDRIRTSLARVELNAGYLGETVVLATGGLESITHTRNGPDIFTDMVVLDGYGPVVQAVENNVIEAGTSVADAIAQLAETLPEVTLGRVMVEGEIGPGGLSISSRTSKILDQLAAQFGFSWSIQNGELEAIQDGQAFNLITEISLGARNLITVSPLLSGPEQQASGVQIDAIMNPNIRPGDLVNVQSEVTPSLSGQYRINAVTFSGGTFINEWVMTVKAFEVG